MTQGFRGQVIGETIYNAISKLSKGNPSRSSNTYICNLSRSLSNAVGTIISLCYLKTLIRRSFQIITENYKTTYPETLLLLIWLSIQEIQSSTLQDLTALPAIVMRYHYVRCNVNRSIILETSTLLSTTSSHSHWNNWSLWTQCSVSCGGGTQVRSRTCDEVGFAMCIGDTIETQTCSMLLCVGK